MVPRRVVLAILLVCTAIAPVLCQKLNWKEYNGKWYSVSVGEAVTWHVAGTTCRQYGGYLASVLTGPERDWMQKAVAESGYTGAFWIGLNNLDRTTWKWSDGSATVPAFWATDFPSSNSEFGEYHLCATQKNGAWENRHCDTTYAYVCKAEIGASKPVEEMTTPAIEGYCPSGYFGAGNKCFKMVFLEPAEGVTWNEALTRCRSGPGVRPDIASVGNHLESALLTSQIQTSTEGLWIGLTRANRNSKWQWMDNSPINFTNWAPNEPSWGFQDNCAELWFHPGPPGKWNNIVCTSKRGYVCQTYKDIKNIVPTTNPTPNTCDTGYIPYWYGCYKFLPIKDTWQKQEDACKADGGHLVSIHYEAENAALMSKVIQYGQKVWIGFRDFKGQGLFEWSDEWQAFYTQWGHDEPSKVVGGGCVAMDTDGRWYDIECNTTISAICKKTSAPPITTPVPMDGACPGEEYGDTDWTKYGQHCYLAVSGYSSWPQAKEECLQRDPAASLVSIHSYPENEHVYGLIKDSGYRSYWIGLYRQSQSGEYAWIDQSAVIYENWAPGEPNSQGTEECVEMYSSTVYPKHWNDHSCSEYRPYVCKTPQAHRLTPPPNIAGKCPDGWVPYGTHCYLFMPDILGTWQTAVTTCRDRGGKDARLPIITSNYQNEFIRDEMVARNEFPEGVGWDYWIGLIKDKPGGEEAFHWMDGSPFEPKVYSRWAYGEPNDHQGQEDCVEAYRSDGTWNDCFCTLTKAVVCQLDKEQPETGLSSGAVAGIVIGAIIVVLLIVLLVAYLLDHHGVVNVRQKINDTKGAMGFSNENFHHERMSDGQAGPTVP